MALGRLASELFCFCFFFFVCVCLLQNLTLDTKRKTREEKKRNKPFRNATTIRPSSCAIANAALLFAHDSSKRSSFSSALLVCSSSPPSSVLWAGRPSPAQPSPHGPGAKGRRSLNAPPNDATPRTRETRREKGKKKGEMSFFFFLFVVGNVATAFCSHR